MDAEPAPRRHESPGRSRKGDQHPAQAKLLRFLLRDVGFEVSVAGDGATGLEVALAARPDAIASDTLMPGLDGYELAVAVRRHPDVARTPIVLYSGALVDGAAHALAREAGADAFVPRTPGFDQVIEALAAGLDRRVPPPVTANGTFERDRAATLGEGLRAAMARNARLAEQLAASSGALAVVAATSEMLASADDPTSAFESILVRCLDAAGIPMGALFTLGRNRRLALAAQMGYSQGAADVVATAFGHAFLLLDVAESGRVLAVPGPEVAPEAAETFLAASGGTSAIVLPLAAGAECVGVIVMVSESKDLAEERWREFARAISVQFSQTLQLARARRESDELARVARTLAESRELPLVAGRIAKAAVAMLDTRCASLWRLGPDGAVVPLVSRDETSRAASLAAGDPGVGAADRVVAENRSIRVEDAPCRRLCFPDATPGRPDPGSCGTVLGVPLRVEGRVIGALCVGDERGRRYTDADVRLLERLGDHAAVALDSAWLFEDAERRRRDAESLALLGRQLSECVDTGEASQRVVDGVCELLDARSAAIYMADAGTRGLRATTVSGNVGDSFRWSPRLSSGSGIAGLALTEGRAVWSADVLDDPRITYDEATRAGIREATHRALLAVPLRPRDRVFGALTVADLTGRRFGEDEVRIAQAFADQAAVVLEKGQLYAEAERRRQEAEEVGARYRTLFDGVPMGLYRSSPDRRLLAANRALLDILRCPDDEALRAIDIRDLYVDDAERRAIAARIEREGAVQGVVARFRRQDGSTLWGRVSARAVTDPEGRVLHYEGALEDITAQRETAEALERSEEQVRQLQKMDAVGRLAGGVAHDFNNLLTVILARAELLLRSMRPADPARKHVTLIAETGKRAADLTRRLLAFGRKQVLQPQVLSLNRVVAGLEPILRRLIGEHIEFATSLAPDLGRVLADPSQIEQVLLNLVVNARDAMPDGGRLVIKTSDLDVDVAVARVHPQLEPDAYVCVEVSDTGCGMDPATMARIFEPFFTTKGPDRGTGLGLATVFGVVKQSGGHVTVYSEPSIGSVFRVYLPRTEQTAEPESSPAARGGRSGTGTVLLAEDEDAVREVAAEMLEEAGYTVLVAATGADALRLATERRPDLLVTDVIMPGMSGPELVRQLREIHPAMKVLYVSGYTDEMIGRRGVLEPGQTLLQKPYSGDRLLETVRDVLEGRLG